MAESLCFRENIYITVGVVKVATTLKMKGSDGPSSPSGSI
jgi:hypothetical protein